MTAGPIDVVEFTDPGCVWSWASEPQLRWLRHHYGDQLRWRRVLGVQLDDLAVAHPTRDAVRDADAFRRDWLEVAGHTDAPVPQRLAWMHRSTRPASHAVKAAALQATERPGLDDVVLRRLREAVFVAGRPADDPARIAAALDGTEGLDLDRLLADLDAPAVVAAVREDWEETRRPHPAVIDRRGPGPNPGAAKRDGQHLRYGFPTLVLRGPAGEQVVSGWRSVDDLRTAVAAVGGDVAAHGGEAPLDPDDALRRWGTLTRADLLLLADQREPRSGVRIATATSPVWARATDVDRLAAGREAVGPRVDDSIHV